MRNDHLVKPRSIAITCLTGLWLVGCSQSSSPGGEHGTGGAGSGGVTATGGTSATGGTTGTGGKTTGSGGAAGGAGGAGSGGSSATGGTSVTGGKSGTGGAGTGGAGTGGTGATGGTKGTGGASATGGSTILDGGAGKGGSTAGASGTGSGGSTAGTSGTGGRATGGSGGGAGDGGTTTGAVPSAGCGKTPTLKNSPTSTANQNSIGSRQFLIRWPTNYDNNHPYRLILDFHGAGGKDTDLAPSYFGLFDLSNNTTIFIAPSANGGMWDATADLTFVDSILKAVEDDLCIDTSRVELEGFSQGGAMVAVLACARPGVFRAAVGHSRGGLTAPSTCQPIPYLGSLGLSDISGNSQATQTDAFAKWNGCTVTTLPTAPTGSHICTTYTNCPAADPVIWCSYDGGHTASPTDAGKSSSWMPSVVWPFLSQF